MAGIFGTDGVRARINTGPMRAEAIVRLALAAGRWFAVSLATNIQAQRQQSLSAKILVCQAI